MASRQESGQRDQRLRRGEITSGFTRGQRICDEEGGGLGGSDLCGSSYPASVKETDLLETY